MNDEAEGVEGTLPSRASLLQLLPPPPENRGGSMQTCLPMFSFSLRASPLILLSLVYVPVSASLSSSTTVTIQAALSLLPFCLSLTVFTRVLPSVTHLANVFPSPGCHSLCDTCDLEMRQASSQSRRGPKSTRAWQGIAGLRGGTEQPTPPRPIIPQRKML